MTVSCLDLLREITVSCLDLLRCTGSCLLDRLLTWRQPGYDDKASSRRVLALLYHRKAELLVARAEFTNALEAIIQMKQALDEIRRGAPPNLHVVCEFASALHCVIAQYCTRLGEASDTSGGANAEQMHQRP